MKTYLRIHKLYNASSGIYNNEASILEMVILVMNSGSAVGNLLNLWNRVVIVCICTNFVFQFFEP